MIGILFTIYILTSLFFFFFPGFIHPRKKYANKVIQAIIAGQGKYVMHISHRGGSRERVENTIESFQNAINQKCNMLELDVVLSKDKKVVVIHDSNLTRLCGKNVHVEDLNYDELPRISDKVLLHFTDGKYFDTTPYKNARFPLLEELFQKFPRTLLHIDLKNGPREVMEEVHKLIVKYNKQDYVIWGNENSTLSDELFKIDPTIPRYFATNEIYKIIFLFLIGLLPFYKIKHESFSVPLPTVEYCQMKTRELGERAPAFLRKVKFCVSLLKPILFHLKKRGVLTIYWVENYDHEFQAAINDGILGVMTDTPTSLREYLEEKNLLLDLK